MKATEQYFHVVLLNMLYKVVLTFKFVDVTRASEFQITASKHAQLSVTLRATIRLKATEQYC